MPGGEPGDQAAQADLHLGEVVDGARRGSRRPDTVRGPDPFDEPVELQPAQRLADRGRADRELLGHAALGHLLARGELAGGDGRRSGLVGLIGERLAPVADRSAVDLTVMAASNMPWQVINATLDDFAIANYRDAGHSRGGPHGRAPTVRDNAVGRTRRITFFIALALFAQESTWNFYDNQVPALLREHVTSAAVVGLLMGMDNLLGIFIQPWIGNRSDNTRTRGGAGSRTWRSGMPVAAVLFLLLPWRRRWAALIVVMFLYALVANTLPAARPSRWCRTSSRPRAAAGRTPS